MHLPPPRLATRRLVIRTAVAADVPAILGYLEARRRAGSRFAPRWPAAHYTAAHWRKQVRVFEGNRRADRGVAFHLFAKSAPGEMAGFVGVSNVVRGAFHGAHLGYALRKEYEGRGLMTEALRAIIPYAFAKMRLHRLMANYMPSNRRSARVLRRFGFRREGLARDYLLIAGRWEDHVLTSLVNPRWRPDPGDAVAAAAAGRPPKRRRRVT
jgi:ribosomal-protein-alanine N-acetyltransferase